MTILKQPDKSTTGTMVFLLVRKTESLSTTRNSLDMSFSSLRDSIRLHIFKVSLDDVFVISRIIEVEIRVISRGRRQRLITLTYTETSLILNNTTTNLINLLRFVHARAHVRALMTRKSCAVGMRNTILRNYLNIIIA